MPVLAALLAAFAGKFFALFSGIFGAIIGMRIAAAVALGTLYVAAVLVFTTVVAPFFGAIVNTQYGYVIGLAFPPMAGTVLAALSGLWIAVAGYRYFAQMMRVVSG